jgi:UDP-N-acetylglucosamine--N-acetylmuramyl-(pentapeptide) pyrophosphoryl-undecaprenol N-acetylglucosamine transferase
VVALPRDDTSAFVSDETAGGALHWVPCHDTGLLQRMRMIADWIDIARPSAVVVDVSVEVATLVRLLGVPVIVVAMPGRRTDAPHDWVYRLANHILACWPRDLYEPDWLRPHRDKTSYVGGVSRFDGRERAQAAGDGRQIVVLGGAGGSRLDLAAVNDCAARFPDHRWRALGISADTWVSDPWPSLCRANLVVAHAGESSIADLAAAGRPALVVPQPRPFEEQYITAAVLAQAGLAVIHPRWPSAAEWLPLIDEARRTDVRRWGRWQTSGAAHRAAAAIEKVASSYEQSGAVS